MEKTWILPNRGEETDIMETILAARGVSSSEDMEEFLSDRPQLTHDPFLMKGMREAAERILTAVNEDTRICIYGDYDADGVCSVCLLMEIIGKLTDKISYYIPSRFEEGYGLNKEAISAIRDRGDQLIVTVDCGSVSCTEAAYAEELGLDIIITDHHNLNDQAVTCLLVNPKQPGCSYPDKELAGCGVAFKLAQALERLSADMEKSVTKADLNKVLDLVAIATIGDIVPLLGENRTLVKYGLKVLNGNGRPGLLKLIRGIGLKPGEVRAEQVAFGVVPHLNAAGRMLVAETGVDLLLSQKEEVLEQAAEQLIQNNKERRRVQEETFEKTLAIVEKEHMEEWILLVDAGDAHEGITGIVAGKLKDTYYKPAIVLTDSGDDMVKGTGRSIEGIDLYELLSAGRRYFTKFGGHKGACGFLMERENLPRLREVLRTSADAIHRTDPDLFQPRLTIDAVLEPEMVDKELIERLEVLEPFGHKNPKPVFGILGQVPTSPFYMGDRGQHVRFRAGDIDIVLFQKAEAFRDHLEGSTLLDVAGYPQINRWNGSEKIQFVAADIRWYNK